MKSWLRQENVRPKKQNFKDFMKLSNFKSGVIEKNIFNENSEALKSHDFDSYNSCVEI